MGVATSLLAFGILLGAGWLGTTCVDEWQIGLLGIWGGLALAYGGGGWYSIDRILASRWGEGRGVLGWGRRVAIPMSPPALRRSVAVVSLAGFGLTLLTNQVFHGGVWGTLHNKSVKPIVEVSEARVAGDALTVRLYRVEGADVYGSFAIGLRVLDASGHELVSWTAEELSQLPVEAIANQYVAKIKPGAHSLILPLGAKADVTLRHPALAGLRAGSGYRVELLDISGAAWQAPLAIVTETGTAPTASRSVGHERR
jgi:thiosulfate dehydrogenase [quinone] large subunit